MKFIIFTIPAFNSPIKNTCDVNDNRFLRKDASNLAAFLLYLKEQHPIVLRKIEGIVCQVAPFFDSFKLEPLLRNPEKIKLEWKEKGNDDYFKRRSIIGWLHYV